MPRRKRVATSSTSSDLSVNSDQHENIKSLPQRKGSVIVLEDLPDPGIVKRDDSGSTMNKSEAKQVVYDLTKNTGAIPKVVKETTVPPKKRTATKIKELPKDNPPKASDAIKNRDTAKQDCINKALGKKPVSRVEPIKPNVVVKKNNEIQAAKEAVQAQREALRKQTALDKQAAEEFDEYYKIFKPGACLKYMNIEIHPQLLSRYYMDEFLHTVADSGISVVQVEDIDPDMITFTRRVPQRLVADEGDVRLAPNKKRSSRAIYVITADKMLSLVASNNMLKHFTEKHELVGGKLTVVVYGTGTLFNSLPHTDEDSCNNRNRFGKAMADLQMDLMLHRRIDVVMLEHSCEIARLVVQYTIAIAEAPYKKAKQDIDERASFFMKGDNKNCVAVDKDGNGLSRLWEQMIAVLPKSSLEIARTLGAKFSTPQALVKELQAPGGLERIADIGVERSNVPGAKPRRLGPEFTRKLYILFTSEDGQLVIE